jgi:hypothetical protein
MKKIYSFLAATVLVIVFGLVFMSQKANSKYDTNSGTLPDDVNTIVKNSCIDCHGEGGSKMAMSHVNFTKWNEYKPEKQASKAEAICNQVTKEKMPPKKFKAEHPDRVPTAAQIKILCDWSNSLNKK